MMAALTAPAPTRHRCGTHADQELYLLSILTRVRLPLVAGNAGETAAVMRYAAQISRAVEDALRALQADAEACPACAS